MTGIVIVVALGTACTITAWIADRHHHHDLARMCWFGAWVLMLAAFTASAAEVAL